MELHTQIKKYRTNMNLSQEGLAEKIYVTRQTISNWENNKNYPDIHSLLLLSSLFNISLDQLIKGDIEIMKEEISKKEERNKDAIQKLNRDGVIYTSILVIFIVSLVPIAVLLGYYGLIISAILFIIAMYFAIQIEKMKKNNDIQTYKEIVSFTEGIQLDEIEIAQEYAKRPYQIVLLPLLFGTIAFAVSLMLVWLLKQFIFS